MSIIWIGNAIQYLCEKMKYLSDGTIAYPTT